MHDAYFTNIFCGIESPESAALRAIKKTVNIQKPILEAIDKLNSYGLEVAAGLIIGFDTDTEQTPQAIAAFIRESQAPIHTVNILYALPKTPLYKRLEQAGRIIPDEGRDSNVKFLTALRRSGFKLARHHLQSVRARSALPALCHTSCKNLPQSPQSQISPAPSHTTQSPPSLFNPRPLDLARRNLLRLSN